MSVLHILQENTIAGLKEMYGMDFTENDFQVNHTKPEFSGDYTVVLFSLVKKLKLSPDEIGNKLGKFARFEHFHHDVRPADEFTLHIKLRDRRPVGIVLDALPDLLVGEHVDVAIGDAHEVQHAGQIGRASCRERVSSPV